MVACALMPFVPDQVSIWTFPFVALLALWLPIALARASHRPRPRRTFALPGLLLFFASAAVSLPIALRNGGALREWAAAGPFGVPRRVRALFRRWSPTTAIRGALVARGGSPRGWSKLSPCLWASSCAKGAASPISQRLSHSLSARRPRALPLLGREAAAGGEPLVRGRAPARHRRPPAIAARRCSGY